jgi:hypothetical protein
MNYSPGRDRIRHERTLTPITMLLGKSNWSPRFARPRIRWMSLMFARVAAMLALVAAVLICWDRNVPWAIIAFMLCVLMILFIEALACDRRRTRNKLNAEDDELVVRRRRETD